MCLGCYAEARFPKIVSPITKRIVELSNRVYEFNGVGGNLHCELDDWNLEDNFFEDSEMKIWHPDTSSPEQIAAERECYAALKAASEDERYSALALRDGYLREDGSLEPSIDEAAWLAQLDEEDAE
jgi:hypothetical protein